MDLDSQAIFFLDMSKCEPAERISQDTDPGAWTTATYEIDTGNGVMLFANHLTAPGPVRLKLVGRKGPIQGWHAIYLGIYYGHHNIRGLVERALKVKMPSDPAYTRVCCEVCNPRKDGDYPEKRLEWVQIAEAFWKCADLTGQDIIFARPERGTYAEQYTNIAYVKLVPLSEPERRAWSAEQPTPQTQCLVASYDGGSFDSWGLTTMDDIREEFEPLRDSDFDIVLSALAYGPICYYPTRVGEVVSPRSVRKKNNAAREMIDNGADALRMSVEAAHELGLKLFPQVRFLGCYLPPGHVREHAGGKLMADHPEWVARAPDGESTRHLSLAFPGVREFYVRLFREWVEDYGADGIACTFSRSWPFAYYEQPVCDAFQARYGEDMRKLPITDERAQRVRAEFVTQFLREIRAMLDEVGRAQGRRISTCYLVPVNHAPPGSDGDDPMGACLFVALDVPAWIREGLVDYLYLHIHVYAQHDGTGMRPCIRQFAELTGGSETKLICDIYPRRMPPRQYRKIAASYYAAGADGLAFWDSNARTFRISEWAFVKRLGHREELESWQGKGDDHYRTVPLRLLDGFKPGSPYFGPTDG